MAEKVSVKTASAIFLLSTVVLALCACVVPVDIEAFLGDDDVIIAIQATQKKVNLTSDSDKGLIAGNCKISGLIPGKYYKIEVIENKVTLEPNFVTANGTTSEDLKDIRKVGNGVVITGLTNDVTYRVKSATAYPNGRIYYFALKETATTPLMPPATVTGGAVTILESRQNCYFQVSPTIDAIKYYDVMQIRTKGTEGTEGWTQAHTSAYRKGPATGTINSINSNDYEKFGPYDIGIYQYANTGVKPPASFTVDVPSFLNNTSIMELPKVNTVNDYVFVEYYAPDDTKPKDVITRDFYVLTVTVNPAPTHGNGDIEITPPDKPTYETITLNPNPTGNNIIPISRGAALADRTITVTTIGSLYKWFYDDNKPISDIPTIDNSSENTIVIDSMTPLKNYSITVEVTVGNVIYSKWFILKITP